MMNRHDSAARLKPVVTNHFVFAGALLAACVLTSVTSTASAAGGNGSTAATWSTDEMPLRPDVIGIEVDFGALRYIGSIG